MCGIFGFCGHVEPRLINARAALMTLQHRGPDDSGEWFSDQIYLGHRRLSIIDLSAKGRHPMTDIDRRVFLTANGEIYNFRELRRQLESDYQFTSQSDCEVLIHGYLQWGLQGLLDRIDGMYAFSLYDTGKNKLFLVRDRVGIKPLFYSQLNGVIAWASELKALQSFHRTDHLSLDDTALFDFLTYNYVPCPKTMYKDVFSLPPAHYLEVDVTSQQAQLHRFWQLEPRTQNRSVDDAAETLRELINQSVQSQLVSDVPVGFFLSGGLDSSAVVSTAARYGKRPKTFTIGFLESSHDESADAQLMAEAVNSEHFTKVLKKNSSENLLEKLIEWYDQPFNDTSALPTYLVSKFARENATVVLTGDGGDELFGGYTRYLTFRNENQAYKKMLAPGGATLVRWRNSASRGSLPQKAFHRLYRRHSLHGFPLYVRLQNGLPDPEKGELIRHLDIPSDYDAYWYFRQYYREDLPARLRLQYLDFHTYLPDEMLTKVDRASMAVALEARVPLLSNALVDFSFSLPESLIYYQGELKGLLKYAFRDLLPAEIINKKKKGFSIPIKNWKSELGYGNSLQEAILRRFLQKEVA